LRRPSYSGTLINEISIAGTHLYPAILREGEEVPFCGFWRGFIARRKTACLVKFVKNFPNE